MRTGISIVGLLALIIIPVNAFCKATADIPTLLKDLRNSDLQIVGEASVSLLKMADTLNPSIVRLACAAAARVKEDKARPWMVKIILNKKFDPSTRALCALAAGQTTFFKDNSNDDKASISTDVLNALIEVLDPSETIRVRAASARSLGYTYSKPAVCPLYGITKDPQDNAIVKYLASNSLTKIVNFIARIEEKKIPSCSPGPEIPPGGSFVTTSQIYSAEVSVITDYGNLVGLALPRKK